MPTLTTIGIWSIAAVFSITAVAVLIANKRDSSRPPFRQVRLDELLLSRKPRHRVMWSASDPRDPRAVLLPADETSWTPEDDSKRNHPVYRMRALNPEQDDD